MSTDGFFVALAPSMTFQFTVSEWSTLWRPELIRELNDFSGQPRQDSGRGGGGGGGIIQPLDDEIISHGIHNIASRQP